MSEKQNRRIALEERRHKVALMKVSGATDFAVVEALAKDGIKVHQSQVSRDYKWVLTQRAKDREAIDQDALDLDIQKMLDRYEGLVMQHWQNRSDPRSAHVILGAMKGIREMLGLDKPRQVELSGQGGAPIQMSIMELAKLASQNGYSTSGRVIEGEVVDS
jgi:hypothetical protein